MESKSAVNPIEDEIKNLLSRLKLQSVSDVSKEIIEVNEDIKYLTRKEEHEKVSELKLKLEDLEKLNSLASKSTFENSHPPPGCENSVTLTDMTSSPNRSTENLPQDEFVVRPDQKTRAINHAFKDVAKMPECSEKTIITLLKLCNLAPEDNLELLKLFETLKNQLETEQEYEKLKTEFGQAVANAQSKNWKFLNSCLVTLYDAFRPFDIDEVLRLIRKTDSSAKLAANQDIILLLGGTGSGKSTTTHFLSGSEMVVRRVNGGFNHIAPGNVLNEALKHVRANPCSQSETRYLTGIPINLLEFKILSGPEEIVVCDTPGLFDTCGAEVDVANGIGIVHAIKGSKSVRLFLLFSYKGGDRFQGLKKSVGTLIRLIPSIEDHLNSFSYGFTKYPKEERQSIPAMVEDLIKQLTPQEKQNTGFKMLLEDMKKKGGLIIDPLSGNHVDLWRDLLKSSTIEHPEEVFNFFITEDSKSKLGQQLQQNQIAILLASKRSDFEFINYKLDQMKKLQQSIQQDFVKYAYEECCGIVSKHINDKIEEVLSFFNRYLENQNTLTKEIIERYVNSVSQLQKSQTLREIHLPKSTMNFTALTQNIVIQFDRISKEIDKLNIDHPSNQSSLINIRLLTTFDSVKDKYTQIIKTLGHKYQESVRNAKEHINKNEFTELCSELYKLRKAKAILESYVDSKILEEYTHVTQYLLSHLESIVKGIMAYLQTVVKIQEKESQHLEQLVMIIERAKETPSLRDHVSYERIKEINELMFTRIVDHFKSVGAKIDDLFSRNDSLTDIEVLMKELEEIRKISGLDTRTAAIYYSIFEKVLGHANEIRRDAENLISEIKTKPNFDAYSRLSDLLLALKNAEWMNHIRPGISEGLMVNIAKGLISHVKKIQEEILDLDFDLTHPNNIKKGFDLLSQLETIQPLEDNVDNLKDYRKNTKEKLENTICNVLNYIQETFDLNKRGSGHLKQELRNLNELKQQCDKMRPSDKYLAEIKKDSIETVKQELESLSKTYNHEKEKLTERQHQSKLRLSALQDILFEYNSLSQQSSPILGYFTSKESSFLKEKGYLGISYLKDDVKQREGEVKKFGDQLNNLTTNYESESKTLKQMVATYEQKLKISSDTDESQSFLKEKNCGFTNIHELSKAIEDKKEKLQSLELQGQSYDFVRIDSTMENSLRYVNECIQIRIFREKAILVSNVLKAYISEYGRSVANEMEKCFNEARNPKNDTSTLFGNSHRLANRMQEFVELESACPQLFSSLNGSQVLNFWTGKFAQNVKDLMMDIEQDFKSDKIGQIREKLVIAKSLSQLDGFINSGKKYFDCYRENQMSVSESFKEVYKTLMKYIESKDYVNVATELTQLDENPINDRAMNQIIYMLSVSVTELVNGTRTRVIMLSKELPAEEIKQIVQGLDKIKSARQHLAVCFEDPNSSKRAPTKAGFIDNEARDKLINGVQEIELLLAEKIIRYLNGIKSFIEVNEFYEAEHRKEHISLIRSLLGNYCVGENIRNIMDDLEQNLESLVQASIKEYTDKDITEYFLYPPKELLSKLHKVVGQNARYAQFLNKFKEDILRTMRKKIGEAKETSPEKRNELFQKIDMALLSLPDDMKVIVENELKSYQELMKREESGFISELETNLKYEDLKSLKVLLDRYKSSNLFSLLAKLREDVLSKCATIKASIIDLLEKEQYRVAFLSYKKLYSYNEVLGKDILELNRPFVDLQDQLAKIFIGFLGCFKNISNYETTELIERVFAGFVEYVEVFYGQEQVLNSIIKEESIRRALTDIVWFFQGCQDEYQKAYESRNLSELRQELDKAKVWSSLFSQVKRLLESTPSLSDFVKAGTLGTTYQEKVTALSRKLVDMKTEIFDADFATNRDTEKSRSEFYQPLSEHVVFLRGSRELKDHINPSIFNVQACEPDLWKHLSSKVDNMLISIRNILNKPTLCDKDYDQLRLNYYNLKSFDNFIKTPKDTNQILNEVDSSIDSRVAKFKAVVQSTSSSIDAVASNLISMKTFSDNLPTFKDKINAEIDDSLKSYKKSRGGLSIPVLSSKLEEDANGVGMEIISEHHSFKGEDRLIRRTKTQQQDIDYVINKIQGNDLDKNVLKSRYNDFTTLYEKIIRKYLVQLEDKTIDVTEIVSEIQIGISKLGNRWDASMLNHIPKLLAQIFSIWTLTNTEQYNEMQEVKSRQKYLLQPHPAQVISIFRILGLGYTKESNSIWDRFIGKTGMKIPNNLAQVGTGEGKSVILAITSCALALLGADVSCACYSEFLSARDYKEFELLFSALNVTAYIHYGTFNKLCEAVINESGDIRQRVCDLIIPRKDIDPSTKTALNRPKVLLIDEVDVFFNESFYGNLYTPLARISDPTITELVYAVWKNQTYSKIINERTYKHCVAYFREWGFLIEEAVRDMIEDLKTYKSHDYICNRDKIGYKEQDSISFDIVYGYKTMFAYMHENSLGKISKESLEENINIGIRCGGFSYAELPLKFQYIMGVTGTLDTLNTPQRKIVEKEYEIVMNTYIPSVFGANNRLFRKEADIHIENKDNWFMKIRDQIDKRLEGKLTGTKRAVLVFFESEQKLMEFYHSSQFQPIAEEAQIMAEGLTAEEKRLRIQRATRSGQVTLLTRSFGRGTDFKCNNQTVINNGGVHVIQTFLSEELSEETQIMGRTARQGDEGSYGMILLDSSLEKYLGTSWETVITAMKNTDTVYSTLNDKRNTLFAEHYDTINKSAGEVKKEHTASLNFIDLLDKKDIINLKGFLKERNIGARIAGNSKTMVLMDATGSMGGLLKKAQHQVGTMFERATVILKENGYADDLFQMQFVVYRDYDCKNNLLQCSPWESKSANLRLFMDGVHAQGGGDYPEAIEIGLWHANQEADTNGLSQVLLIGDAPAKSKTEIAKDRGTYGGDVYWSTTKFKTPTFYQDEMAKLNARKIPVHTFYLDGGAQKNFAEIAAATNGKCEALDASSAGTDRLTQVVTEAILQNVGGTSGAVLVEAYRAKFERKTYK